MSSTGRATVLVICMFLLASSSHLQAARVVDHRVRVHDKKKAPVSTSNSATAGSARPCLHDQPAEDIASDGHGRALWSTPSDGVGH
ncbi:hypothetical protein BS78_02G139700 [Paspalum vaginatum]|nr:hypothetical protein BS78_02G139700 [Paspalum vaginatum]